MAARQNSPELKRLLATSPAVSPPSGAVLTYFKADGKLYKKDSAGIETEIGGVSVGGGGIEATLVDAKGDLIVGTANDTVDRQPVGGDGTILVARSATSTGVAWEAAQAAVGEIPSSSAALPTPSAIDMGAVGLSGEWEDLPGLSSSITIAATVRINAVTGFGFTLSSGNTASECGVRVRVTGNGQAEQVGSAARVVIPRSSDLDAGTARVLTNALPPGTYTAQVQWRRVSGSTTPQASTGSLFVQAMQGAQGPQGPPGETPPLGTAATRNVPASGDASATEVALGSDTRLSNARTPTAHSHAIGDLPVAPSGTSNTTQVVRADDSRLSNARTPTTHSHAIGDLPVAASGTSNTTQVVRADDSRLSNARTPVSHTHVKADVTDFAHTHAIGDLPVAASGTSNATQVVRADDSRLSNARTPTAHTHGVTDLTATGTRDATTFLRGDNTWATPAGGGGSSSADYDLTQDYTDTQPASPTTGLTLFARHRARRLLATVGPQGQDTPLQPSLFSNRIAMWNAVNNNTTPQMYGLAASVAGSAAAVAPVSTSFFGGMVRLRYASVATAGNAAGIRSATTQWFLSSTANLGGFFFVARWGMNQVTATNRIFVGLHTPAASSTSAAAAAIAGGTNPSALTNMIGFGCDASQTTLRLMHNDATGTATAVDLGANFPATTAATNFYETRLFAPSGGGQQVFYSITRLNDGTVAQGSVSTDLPALGTQLAAYVHHSNGTTATAVHMDIQSLYVESDN